MQVEYNFDFNDWIAFQESYMEQSKSVRNIKRRQIILFPLINGLLILLELLAGRLTLPFVVFITLISFGWIIIYPKMYRNTVLKRTKKIFTEIDNSGFLGIHKLELNEEGIVLTVPESESKITWNGIKKMDETPDFYFLYWCSANAVMIPKRKIENQLDQVDEFLKRHLG